MVKLTDFGITKQLDESSALANTFKGTLTYLSPERI
jgi:serine/threonine protein kinase